MWTIRNNMSSPESTVVVRIITSMTLITIPEHVFQTDVSQMCKTCINPDSSSVRRCCPYGAWRCLFPPCWWSLSAFTSSSSRWRSGSATVSRCVPYLVKHHRSRMLGYKIYNVVCKKTNNMIVTTFLIVATNNCVKKHNGNYLLKVATYNCVKTIMVTTS